MYRKARCAGSSARSAPWRTASWARTSAMPSWAKARGSFRYRLRENWSSTMTSASRPDGVARHDHSSPAAAWACSVRKRSRMEASKAGSLLKCCFGEASLNQKCRTVSGAGRVAAGVVMSCKGAGAWRRVALRVPTGRASGVPVSQPSRQPVTGWMPGENRESRARNEKSSQGVSQGCFFESGGRYWVRTSDPCRVKAVLYR